MLFFCANIIFPIDIYSVCRFIAWSYKPILLEIREEEKLKEPTYLFLVQNGAKKDFNKIFNSLIIWLNNQEQGTLFQIL